MGFSPSSRACPCLLSSLQLSPLQTLQILSIPHQCPLPGPLLQVSSQAAVSHSFSNFLFSFLDFCPIQPLSPTCLYFTAFSSSPFRTHLLSKPSLLPFTPCFHKFLAMFSNFGSLWFLKYILSSPLPESISKGEGSIFFSPLTVIWYQAGQAQGGWKQQRL